MKCQDNPECAEPIDTKPQTPNQQFSFTSSNHGFHYFACGLDYNSTTGIGGHCNDGHVRAVVHVVKDPSECLFHGPGPILPPQQD